MNRASDMSRPVPGDPSGAVTALVDEAGSTAQLVADLAVAAADPTWVEANPDARALVHLVPEGYEVVVTEIAEDPSYLDHPRAKRGHVTVHDSASFGAYFARHYIPGRTEVFADVTTGRITATFDAHQEGAEGLAGWAQHLLTLNLQADPSWTAWTTNNGKLLPQGAFAEFVEQRVADIIEPSGADMLEVATTLEATRTATFDAKAVRLDNGDRRFAFAETTTAQAGTRGVLDVPSRFVVRCHPYLGGPFARVEAALRYRVTDSGLHIGYALIAPEDAVRSVFDAVVTEVEEKTGPVFRGRRG